MYTLKEIERFWSKVDKERSQIFYNGTRCWEWVGAKDGKGYGELTILQKRKSSHRFAYELTFGELPAKTEVCHYCDNPVCCNPEHFWAGTHQENMADMVYKKRTISRELHWNAKLSESQISDIRRRYKPFGIGGESAYRLAKEFGVTKSHISNIVKGKVWK
jgi:hypothetical protein